MTEVVVHTRPGCPYCTSLRMGLRRQRLDFREVDIWQDPAAAAAVRAAADGNETVPTVNIGSWWAVNPSTAEVMAAVAAEAPELLPPPRENLLSKLGLRKSSGDRAE